MEFFLNLLSIVFLMLSIFFLRSAEKSKKSALEIEKKIAKGRASIKSLQERYKKLAPKIVPHEEIKELKKNCFRSSH